MKKNRKRWYPEEGIPGKFLRKMKLILFLCWAGMMQVSAMSYAQTGTVSIRVKETALHEIFQLIEAQCGYTFVYNNEQLNGLKPVSIEMTDAKISKVLDECLKGTDLRYELLDQIIVINRRSALPQTALDLQGTVKDKEGNPLPGVSVFIKGTTIGVATDVDGKFKMQLPEMENMVLVFSFTGMKKQEVKYTKQPVLNIVMEEDVAEMEEVVVNGYFTKNKDSFTGNAVVVSKDELAKVSSNNLLSALQVFDPSFRLKDNVDMGSNPNSMPNFRIRGNSGFGAEGLSEANLKNDPNLPTFILDGYEVDVEKIFDLNMDRIESVTILKDASATAIYGSRAANGVVVVTTKAPQEGQLRVSYNLNVAISAPDLSDYHLLNAREKLDLELRSGYYDNVRAEKEVALKQKYNEILQQVERGVNTYWLSKPLRVGIGHRHNIKLEGGDPSFRYSATAQYNDVAGVMKESFRRTFNGGINLSYKTSELIFRNQLTISLNKAQESPYGTFDEYVKLNPYWTATDENGNIKRFFDEDYEYWGGSYPANPLYNATLNTKETSDYTNITNNFSMEWKPIQEFTLRGTFGIYTQTSNTDNYLPPEHTSFADYTDENYFRRGSYDYSTNKSSRYNFSLTANYSKVFAEKHMVYAGLNMDLEDQRSRGYSFSVEGFPSGSLDFLSVAMQYKENGKPGGSESKSRRVGFVGNASYSFEDRYFVDASFRTDGSSLYGSDRRFAPFWSAGIGWNIHREGFMSDVDWINRLKIRASVGETGSNNFSSYEAMATYAYSLSDRYYNWMGANMKALANPDLEWQKTMKYNAGIEVNMLNNRLSMICDLYLERTNGLMSSLELPPSNGFSSYKANIGKLENKGFELKVTGYLLRDTERELIWSVTGSLVRNKDKIIELSEAMKEANATLLETGGATPNKIWQEGDSQNAIYAVRSLGIDPSNGRELFLKKNGEVTYTWDANDRVFCGVDQPDYRGNINTMFMWKDLSVNLSFGYEWGGQQYNSTLISRVENADKKYNVDRRVYEDRWKEPGDRTFFKGINETTATQATSRFVQDEATFTCQNLNVTYDLKGNKWLKRNLGIQTLTLKGDIADLFRISTIKQERGTSYPFSRQFSFTLSAMF